MTFVCYIKDTKCLDTLDFADDLGTVRYIGLLSHTKARGIIASRQMLDIEMDFGIHEERERKFKNRIY